MAPFPKAVPFADLPVGATFYWEDDWARQVFQKASPTTYRTTDHVGVVIATADLGKMAVRVQTGSA
jgi:hypothetical protein